MRKLNVSSCESNFSTILKKSINKKIKIICIYLPLSNKPLYRIGLLISLFTQGMIIGLLSIFKETLPEVSISFLKVVVDMSASFSIKIYIFSFKVKLMVYRKK